MSYVVNVGVVNVRVENVRVVTVRVVNVRVVNVRVVNVLGGNCSDIVYRHQSLRSTGYISNSKLFQAMFPDSSIAKDFSLSAAQLSFIVNHELAPYFKNQIMRELVPKDQGSLPNLCLVLMSHSTKPLYQNKWIFISYILTRSQKKLNVHT